MNDHCMRYDQLKFDMPGLVPEDMHSQKSSKSPAHYRGKYQRLFTYSPFFIDSPLLINSV